MYRDLGGNRALFLQPHTFIFIDRTALPGMGKPIYSYTLKQLELYLSREWGEKVQVQHNAI